MSCKLINIKLQMMSSAQVSSVDKRKIRSVSRSIASLVLIGSLVWTSAAFSAPPMAEVFEYEVIGNSLIPIVKIQELLKPYTGQQSLEGITAASIALQNLYVQAGYAGVITSVPEQTLSSGKVRINVLEGKLDQIVVQGNERFSNQNVKAGLPSLKVGFTPNLVDLDTHTLMVNENPAKTVRVVFQPGLRVGQLDALVVTDEQNPIQWAATADNTGSLSSGRYRGSLAFQHANVFDLDHVLNVRLNTSFSDPANSFAAGVGYRIPLYDKFASVDLLASYSNVKNRTTPTAAGDLSFAGEGQAVGVRYNWHLPRFGKSKQKISAGLDWRQYRNTCSIGVFGSQGCGPAAASVEVHPVTLAYQLFDPGNYSASVQFASNVLAGGSLGQAQNFENSRPGAKPRYWMLSGGYQLVRSLENRSTLSWRANAQHSPHALISAEQFGIGGATTVRGFIERELVGDQGAATSVEWSTSLLGALQSLGQSGGSRQLVGTAFLDAGVVNNQLGAVCQIGKTTCSIAGAGIGLTLSQDRRWSLKADLARALTAGTVTQRGDYRLHFLASLAF